SHFYPPDPSSQIVCSIGGNIAENSGGAHCFKYGFTTNYVLGLEIVLSDGTVVSLDRDAPGYDLLGAFVGSEGTLGVATQITLRVVPRPEAVRTLVAFFEDTGSAGDRGADGAQRGRARADLEGAKGCLRGDGACRSGLLRAGRRDPPHAAVRGASPDRRARRGVRAAGGERVPRRRRKSPPARLLRRRPSGRARARGAARGNDHQDLRRGRRLDHRGTRRRRRQE